MISITKEDNIYYLTAKQKRPLKDLRLEFESYEKMAFWLDQECDKHFEDMKPKTPIELEFE